MITARGKGKQLDRIATPAVNVALVPFAARTSTTPPPRTTTRGGTFADDIVATLQALGANQAAIDTLAGVAVTNGDYVRVNLTTANTGPGGGDNPGAGFPNGRRLKDDTIDTILTIIANGTPLGDNVDANDVPLRDAFPFVAPAPAAAATPARSTTTRGTESRRRRRRHQSHANLRSLSPVRRGAGWGGGAGLVGQAFLSASTRGVERVRGCAARQAGMPARNACPTRAKCVFSR